MLPHYITYLYYEPWHGLIAYTITYKHAVIDDSGNIPDALSFTKIWKRLPGHHIHHTYHYNLFFDWYLFHDCYWECVPSSWSTLPVIVHFYYWSFLQGHTSEGSFRTNHLMGYGTQVYGWVRRFDRIDSVYHLELVCTPGFIWGFYSLLFLI